MNIKWHTYVEFEWYTVLCLPCGWWQIWVPAELHQCLWTCLQVSKRLGCHAGLYTVYCKGVSEVNLRITQARKHTKRDPPWLRNPGQMSPEVQNRGISGPTKRTYAFKIVFLKSNIHTEFHVFDRLLYNNKIVRMVDHAFEGLQELKILWVSLLMILFRLQNRKLLMIIHQA